MRKTLPGLALALAVTTPAWAQEAPEKRPLFFKQDQVAEVWPLYQQLHGDRFAGNGMARLFLRHAIADLNGDGQNEILLRNGESEACNQLACPTIVAEFDGGDWKEIGLFSSTLIEYEAQPDAHAVLYVYEGYGRRAEPVTYRFEDGRYERDLSGYGDVLAMEVLDTSEGYGMELLDRVAPQESLIMSSSAAPGDRVLMGQGDLNHDGKPETFLRLEHASVCMPEAGCPLLMISNLDAGAFASTWSAPGSDVVLMNPESWDRLKSILVTREGIPVQLTWVPDQGYQEAPF